MRFNRFPNYIQPDSKDCGPTCLKILAKFYGRIINLQTLRNLSETTRVGSSLYNLSEAAEKIGFHTVGVKFGLTDLKKAPLPAVILWNDVHYVVLYKIKNEKFFISDPAHGLINYKQDEFFKNWMGEKYSYGDKEGIALILETRPDFYEDNTKSADSSLGFSFLFRYLKKYKIFLWQLAIGLLASSLLQLIFPFLTQNIVDIGIKNNDINFIYLILIGQLAIFAGRTAIEVIRGWILLHLSTRININLVTDFFIKLMNLPISFFDTRMTGDILQRISDHRRIERLLTTSSLNVLFSMVTLLVFSLVLLYYSSLIFLIFLLGSIMYFLWIIIFLRKRRDLDYKYFFQMSSSQGKVVEFIDGMQEIKLHNAERQKRWSWEYIQARLFKVSIKSLALEQYQTVGSGVINEIKNILITIIAAKLVIEGEITLGMMVSTTYIVGQLNSPVSQLINFIRELQDAKISLERLSEIHNKKNEDDLDTPTITTFNTSSGFKINNLSYRYQGSDQIILNNLNIAIPANKITAIVGASGSGKTTLMKILLKFYLPTKGTISFGPYDLKSVSHRSWRNKCGVVMQEGYIFSDTIANNIAVGDEIINEKRLKQAVEIANIKEFIDSLPRSYNTNIGMEGMGLSTGQKQRLLIARAVYKNPEYLFFDEATSSLDANNEKIIMDNLNIFFKNRTVLIIAHRLSTVKNADQIVVLDKGRIVERGNHQELVKLKKSYYQLVKNQLELGN